VHSENIAVQIWKNHDLTLLAQACVDLRTYAYDRLSVRYIEYVAILGLYELPNVPMNKLAEFIEGEIERFNKLSTEEQ
jgi:hypothetical protein